MLLRPARGDSEMLAIALPTREHSWSRRRVARTCLPRRILLDQEAGNEGPLRLEDRDLVANSALPTEVRRFQLLDAGSRRRYGERCRGSVWYGRAPAPES